MRTRRVRIAAACQQYRVGGVRHSLAVEQVRLRSGSPCGIGLRGLRVYRRPGAQGRSALQCRRHGTNITAAKRQQPLLIQALERRHGPLSAIRQRRPGVGASRTCCLGRVPARPLAPDVHTRGRLPTRQPPQAERPPVQPQQAAPQQPGNAECTTPPEAAAALLRLCLHLGGGPGTGLTLAPLQLPPCRRPSPRAWRTSRPWT